MWAGSPGDFTPAIGTFPICHFGGSMTDLYRRKKEIPSIFRNADAYSIENVKNQMT